MIREVSHIYDEYIGESVVRRGAEGVFIYNPIVPSLMKKVYWTVAPSCYRRWYPTDFERDPAKPDLLKLVRVDPTGIERFTGRCYPPWWRRRELFGSVLDGEWDQRSCDETPVLGGPPSRLFLAESITDTPLFQAMKRHFVDGVPWTETRFVQEVISLLETGEAGIWHGSCNRDDVLDRCEQLESIYRDMSRRGCLSYRERLPPQDRCGNVIDAMEEEILVDIGRDGELLLVSGKHRVALARLIGLETVPVGFLVRHADWMETRRRALSGDRDCDHPDLRALRPQSG